MIVQYTHMFFLKYTFIIYVCYINWDLFWSSGNCKITGGTNLNHKNQVSTLEIGGWWLEVGMSALHCGSSQQWFCNRKCDLDSTTAYEYAKVYCVISIVCSVDFSGKNQELNPPKAFVRGRAWLEWELLKYANMEYRSNIARYTVTLRRNDLEVTSEL